MIRTQRLDLLPYSPEHWLALIESEQAFEAVFGIPSAEGLRSFILSDDVSPVWIAQLREATDADLWTHGMAIVHREAQLVIGNVGFKGSPDSEGMVEIAYGIVPGYQNRGCATEATAAVVTFLHDVPRVQVIRAHTLPDNNPSKRVLEKCGFTYLGVVEDPEDGPVLRWERGNTP